VITLSDAFLPALASPQQITVRADVAKAGVQLFADLPVLDGGVRVDTASITRRELTMVLAPRLRTGTYTDAPTLPGTYTDPLGHYGQEVSVQWGLTYPDGSTEWCPLGVFRIDSHDGSLFHDDQVLVTGVSREAFVADDRFESPRTMSGPSAQALIADLIHETLPGVEVVSTTASDRRVPRTTWQRDRWEEAIVGLASSIGAQVYADPWGRFVIADLPTTDTPPVWRVAAGPGGVLTGAQASSTRRRTYNSVVVIGGSASSDVAPVSAVARDTAASSPTRWGDPADGAWGKRAYFMYVPTITTYDQALAVARANLAQHVGAASTMDLTAVPNPALEGNDVVDVVVDPSDPASSGRRHAVDALTVPLKAGGRFAASTRDLRNATDE